MSGPTHFDGQTQWQQSGTAADAVGKLHDELTKQYSAISDAEEGLSEVLLNAQAATAAGRQQLSEIQGKIIDAVNNPSMSIDTPAGERSFLAFLHGQVGAINDLVTSGSLTADDQAKTASALSKLYGANDQVASGGQPPPQPSAPEPAADAGPPVDAGLGPEEPVPDPWSSLASELPGALGGSGGSPLDGVGGLAGAIAQLAGLGSQASEGGTEHDRAPDTVEKADDSTDRTRESKDTAGGADKPDPVGKQSDKANGQPAAGGAGPVPVAPSPTCTVRLPDGSSANARTPATAQAVAAYLGGDTVDAAYRKNNLALPPPGTPVTDPVDPSRLACGDVGIFRDHYVVALSSVKALANGQVVALGSVASSPDFLGWIDPTATAGRPQNAPPPPVDALADAAPPSPLAVPAG